jgi:hypothetical protein
MKEKAIKKLMESGMTEREAISEFNDTVNYYLIGTLHTAADRVYATKCAIDDILDGPAEITEIDQAMLEMMY